MSETKYSQKNIADMTTHIDNIEQLVRFQISSNAGTKAAVEQYLRDREGSAKAYLALSEGPASQETIAKALSMSQPTVSRILQHLADNGLIRAIRPVGKGKTQYAWSELERLVKVSAIATRVTKEDGSGKKKKP